MHALMNGTALPILDTVRQDAFLAIRSLARSPGFTLSSVSVLGLGIGASVAIFSVVYPVVLKPLPFDQPNQLVMIWQQDQQGDLREVSYREFQGWRDQARSFSSMAAIGSVNWSYQASEVDEPYVIPINVVSASFFDTLGAPPLLGRTFVASDDEASPATGRVVVLSHALWVDRFDANAGVVGQPVRLLTAREEAVPFTVIGVMPPDFRFPAGAELWTPVAPELESIRLADGSTEDRMNFLRVLFVVGRLATGVSLDAARTDIDTLIPRLPETLAADVQVEDFRSVMTPLQEHIFGNARTALLLFAASVGLVLLIANANVVGLMVVRGLARRRDTAVRQALGASRARLLGYHIVEAGVIAAGGGALGVLLAAVGVPALVALNPDAVPGLDTVAVDLRALAFVVFITAACALTVGVGASVRLDDAWLPYWLKAGAVSLTPGTSHTRTRDVLMGVQVALALMALSAAGLLTVSYANLVRENLGFRPQNVLTLNVDLPDARYSLAQHRLFYRELLDRVSGLPGVVGAAAAYQRPFEHGAIGLDFLPFLRGQTPGDPASRQNPLVNLESITPGYFSVMGTRLLRGRTFTNLDTADSPPVVVLSESAARRLWPGEEGLGQQLLVTPDVRMDENGDPIFQTVVGIVEDARYREVETPRLDAYVPFSQVPVQVKHLVVRTTDDPLQLAAAVRSEVRRLDPQQVVDGVRSMERVVSTATRPWRFNMVISAILGAIAVVLTAIGLFSTVAYTVRQRTREIGLRIALGATRRHIRDLVTRRVLGVTAIGATAGLAGALVVAESLDSLVFGIAPRDPFALLAVAALFIAVAATASLLAARAGTRVDPMVSLRAE